MAPFCICNSQKTTDLFFMTWGRRMLVGYAYRQLFGVLLVSARPNGSGQPLLKLKQSQTTCFSLHSKPKSTT